MITVKLVDDHIATSEGISSLLEKSGKVTVTEQIDNLDSARKSLEEQLPDILLLDICFPSGNGLDFLKELSERYPRLKVIVYTGLTECNPCKTAMKYRAKGYVLKNKASEELLLAVETVYEGGEYISREMADICKNDPHQPFILTPREQEILEYIETGLTSRQIAKMIDRNVENVNSFRDQLFTKFDVHSVGALVSKAVRCGFLASNHLHKFERKKDFIVFAINKCCDMIDHSSPGNEKKSSRKSQEAFEFLEKYGFIDYIKKHYNVLCTYDPKRIEALFREFVEKKDITVFPGSKPIKKFAP
jgi:DNA-binding NarL/FixJ family response regulator